MAETKEVAEKGVPNPDDGMQICCIHGIFYPSKIKEKLDEVLSCCFPNQDEPQEELDVILAPFHEYCGLESQEQKEQLQEIKKQLDKVLADGKAKYESLLQDTPRQRRKKWRDSRINIYNYLLRLALIGPNESEDLWLKNQEFTNDGYYRAFQELESGRFYTYLLDQVHEDEEIMFKYYCTYKGVEKPFAWRKNATWLVGSIDVYFDKVVDEVLEALKTWEDGKPDLCDKLVTKAKKQFVDSMLKLHGRCFKKERNWRNRARFYYLLGLRRHSGISKGRLGKFKNLDYEGPFNRIVCEMIVEDEDLFDQESKDQESKDQENKDQESKGQDFLLVCKEKYGKQNNGSFLGHLRLNRLLAWASAANDLGFVKLLLKYYLNSVKSHSNFDFKSEESMGESWAMALWNASYKGYAEIVKELLAWEIPYHSYYFKYFSDKTITPLHELPWEPPLHIAVLKMNVSVVDAFCTTTSLHLDCNQKNSHGFTPLEIATNLKVTNDQTKTIKRKIQNLLLQQQEVKDAVAEASSQRQLVVDSSNAVMVGGTLIAGITFGGWLSPPLGYNSYYQLVETTPAAPPDSYESYMSVQGHLSIQLFAIFNSLSFYFAIASVVAGMETFGAIKVLEDIYAMKTVKKLRHKLSWATNLFLASVVCVLVAFSCAGIAVLPPIKRYQTNMYFTTAIGGFICVLFICKMGWYVLSKKFRNKVNSKLQLMLDKWKK